MAYTLTLTDSTTSLDLIDGTNYDLYASQAVTVGAGDERAFDAEFSTNQAWKLTYTEDVDEGGNKAIPFNVITQVVE